MFILYCTVENSTDDTASIDLTQMSYKLADDVYEARNKSIQMALTFIEKHVGDTYKCSSEIKNKIEDLFSISPITHDAVFEIRDCKFIGQFYPNGIYEIFMQQHKHQESLYIRIC